MELNSDVLLLCLASLCIAKIVIYYICEKQRKEDNRLGVGLFRRHPSAQVINREYDGYDHYITCLTEINGEILCIRSTVTSLQYHSVSTKSKVWVYPKKREPTFNSLDYYIEYGISTSEITIDYFNIQLDNCMKK